MHAGRPSPLRVRRILRGARLRDIATATGVQVMSLSELERGERPLAGRMLGILADYYQTAPERLVVEMARWAAREAAGSEVKGP
jgi:transcriptional regulator with XRE-family HTH domain